MICFYCHNCPAITSSITSEYKTTYDYTLPLLTSYFGEDIYTLIVIVDSNGDGIRNSGDWEGINDPASNDYSEAESITISQI